MGVCQVQGSAIGTVEAREKSINVPSCLSERQLCVLQAVVCITGSCLHTLNLDGSCRLALLSSEQPRVPFTFEPLLLLSIQPVLAQAKCVFHMLTIPASSITCSHREDNHLNS